MIVILLHFYYCMSEFNWTKSCSQIGYCPRSIYCGKEARKILSVWELLAAAIVVSSNIANANGKLSLLLPRCSTLYVSL